ncbi:unnamed protein product [Porites lobata]|uniref:Uncharacterized protein n=1 Tax=Porites lobata TaxID=104759 RepID=A0ABN8NMR9_9CNID|nr:unnamed protein product [Porites lobata]
MRSSLFAIAFGVCLVIQPINSRVICGKNQYRIVNSTGTFQRCLYCDTCHKGFGLHPECGSTLLDPPTTGCHACKVGTFSSEYDSSPCKACHHCAEHEIKNAECTNKSDTVCSGKCEQGYFMSKTVHNCQECSACCLDGKDEKVQECARLAIDKDCSPRPDRNCGSSNPGASDSKKPLSISYIIIIVFGVLGFLVAVCLLILMAYCWQKRHRQSGQQPEEQRNGSANTSSSHKYVREGPRTESKVTFDSHCGVNPSYHGTPRALREEVKVEEPKPVPCKDGIALVALPEEKQKSTNNKNNDKPSVVSRQGSQDSQTSGDFRKRSFSSRSIGELVEKIGSLKRDNSLLESDEDSETHEPIKISKHPKSQTAKEGSKVELACKLEKKSKNFMYQWFKDDVALIGQDKSVLDLNPVQLRDFGCYMCRVSYKDLFGEAEKSKPARLDVIPHPGLNGMRLKRLAELDVGIMDRVALLLETRKHGCGDWRRIGSKHDMEDPDIAALANAPSNAGDRGKAVLDFVKATKPNLTVYDFCKTLKEDNFKRLDIVKELENHFLVSIESDGQ